MVLLVFVFDKKELSTFIVFAKRINNRLVTGGLFNARSYSRIQIIHGKKFLLVILERFNDETHELAFTWHFFQAAARHDVPAPHGVFILIWNCDDLTFCLQ